MENLWILAQAGTSEAPTHIQSEPLGTDGAAGTKADGNPSTPPNGVPAAKQGSIYSTLFLMVAVFVVMYIILLRSPRKQEQQRRQMVQSLKKNDRVRTIGGIYGTVMDVKGDEVVLKVDEATNTKIHVSTSAINKNLSQEGKE